MNPRSLLPSAALLFPAGCAHDPPRRSSEELVAVEDALPSGWYAGAVDLLDDDPAWIATTPGGWEVRTRTTAVAGPPGYQEPNGLRAPSDGSIWLVAHATSDAPGELFRYAAGTWEALPAPAGVEPVWGMAANDGQRAWVAADEVGTLDRMVCAVQDTGWDCALGQPDVLVLTETKAWSLWGAYFGFPTLSVQDLEAGPGSTSVDFELPGPTSTAELHAVPGTDRVIVRGDASTDGDVPAGSSWFVFDPSGHVETFVGYGALITPSADEIYLVDQDEDYDSSCSFQGLDVQCTTGEIYWSQCVVYQVADGQRTEVAHLDAKGELLEPFGLALDGELFVQFGPGWYQLP